MPAARRHRLSAWIATLALLWAALAPAFADRVHSGTPAEMLQVCSVMGTMMLPMDGAPAGDDGAATTASHCPWCALQAHTLALPAPVVTVRGVPLLHQVPSVDNGQAPRPAQVWPSARSRAPPALA